MNLNLGISPCPNDTYIFEGMATGTVSNPALSLNFSYHDIADLNKLAGTNKLDIVKVSYAKYFQIADEYILLRSGGAMGFGVGPLLLSKMKIDAPTKHHTVAIPGLHTTANFLLQYAFPQLTKKTAIPFDVIERKVLAEVFDLGLVIHESRFTYQNKGLHKVIDLGAYWEEKENLPIPLGGIAIKRSLSKQLGNTVNQLIKESLGWQKTRDYISEYIRRHAQEMDKNVMKQHIDLYVNDFSFDIGEKGERAIKHMKDILLPNFDKPIFIEC